MSLHMTPPQEWINTKNIYNSSNTAYEDGANNEEDCTTHEDGTIYNENNPTHYEQETMDNNSTEKEPGMGAAEETEILDAIETYIAVSAIYTAVDMETTGVDAENTVVRVKIIGVGI